MQDRCPHGIPSGTLPKTTGGSSGYVCDTNVWYDIGAGTLEPAKLKVAGNRLLSPAINALEISTNLDDRTFASRNSHRKQFLTMPTLTSKTTSVEC